jgi:hypothetical protein
MTGPVYIRSMSLFEKSSQEEDGMVRKLGSLAAGLMIAAVLAVPALADNGKGHQGKGEATSACKQAVRDAQKAFHVDQRKAWVAFVKQQAADRKAYRNAQPSHTADEIKAFHKDQRAKRREFQKQAHDARVANRETQRKALDACA